MKTIHSVIFVTLCLTFVSCDIPGTLISRRITSRAVTCVGSFFPVCENCTTLVKCENADTPPPVKINCKEEYPTQPYCVNGGCTSQETAECLAETQTPFQCTDGGYFPDPLNCSRYHLCSAAGATGLGVATYECPRGWVYNTVSTMCKQLVSSADCAVVTCTAGSIGFVVYPANNTYFASCRSDKDPLMLRCPVNNVYDESAHICVFKCPHEGRIADPLNVTKYYECYFDGATYFSQWLSCVEGYDFVARSQQCEKRVQPPVG